jgi:hypothetical protein
MAAASAVRRLSGMSAPVDSTAAIRAATVKTISKHAGTVLEQLEREGDQQASDVCC